jgi:hypothetical protein
MCGCMVEGLKGEMVMPITVLLGVTMLWFDSTLLISEESPALFVQAFRMSYCHLHQDEQTCRHLAALV